MCPPEDPNGPAGDEPADRKSGWRRLLRLPVVLGGAAATALVGFLINEFAPRAVERIEDQRPLQVAADYDHDRYSDGWVMATPRSVRPSSAPRPGATCDDAWGWAQRAGGALVDEGWLRVLFEGRRKDGLVIKSMRARSLSRGAALAGSRIACPSAGAKENIAVGFDLDAPAPVARSVSAEGRLGRPYFSDRSITLAKGEKATLSVVGKSRRSYHRWVIDVRLSVDGREETVTVGGNGYRTTAAAPRYLTSWAWRWDMQPARLAPELPPKPTSAPTSDEPLASCENRAIPAHDRQQLATVADSPEAPLAGSVYFGSCETASFAIARFAGPPRSGVFRRDEGGEWAFLGTIDDARCGVPEALRTAWKLDPCS